jgi:hypothetical protein
MRSFWLLLGAVRSAGHDAGEGNTGEERRRALRFTRNHLDVKSL